MRLSDKLFKQMREIRFKAYNGILDIMQAHGDTIVDFSIDPQGRTQKDDDYDWEWFEDEKMYVNCYGRCGIEEGWIAKAENVDGALELTAYSECGEYSLGHMDNSVGTLAMVLYALESKYGVK